MKHSINELYKINGKQGVFTADAVRGLTNVYPLPANPEPKKGYRFVYTNREKTVRKMVFTYGEKTWFDTEEERDAYREEQNIVRKEKSSRAAIKREIDKELSSCDLEKLKKVLEMIKSV